MLYITTTVVTVLYIALWSDFAATLSRYPPPNPMRSNNPTLTKNFLFFFKNKVMVSIEKNQTFSFYIFFFL